MIKTPSFYYQKISIFSLLLLPFSLVYYVASIVRRRLIKTHILKKKFVICVGNANIGGGGKTPSAIFISQILKELKIDFCFVSKGTGRKSKGFFEVKASDDPRRSGDEPLCLAQFGKTLIFSKYHEIIENLKLITPGVIIMDDGMQNPTIHKDLTILVVDSSMKFGNKLLFPAGPLRQSAASAIKQSDAIFQIGGKAFLKELENSKLPKFLIKTNYSVIDLFHNPSNCEKLFAKFEGEERTLHIVNEGYGRGLSPPPISKQKNHSKITKKDKFLAFSGLANNHKFFNAAAKYGLSIETKLEFKDHHTYSNRDIEKIKSLARGGLKILTTEKDAVKLVNFDIDINILKLHFSSSKKMDILKFIQKSIDKV